MFHTYDNMNPSKDMSVENKMLFAPRDFSGPEINIMPQSQLSIPLAIMAVNILADQPPPNEFIYMVDLGRGILVLTTLISGLSLYLVWRGHQRGNRDES